MLTQCAIVIKHLPEALELATTRPAACARCEQGRGCGGGIFGLLAGGKQSQLLRLPMAHPERFMPGRQVTVTLPGRALIALTAFVYGLPLLALIVGAWIGQWLGKLAVPAAALGTDIIRLEAPISAAASSPWPALLGAFVSLGMTVTALATYSTRLQTYLLLNQLKIVDHSDATT